MEFNRLKQYQQLPNVIIAVLLFCFAVLYLATIDRAGFWFDEVETIFDLRESFLQMVENRTLRGHGPVYFTMAWLWHSLVGDSEWLLRLPSLLAWLSVVVISSFMVRRHVSPWVGVIVTLFLLINPTLVHLAHLVRPYALAILLALISMALMLRYEDRPRLKDSFVLAILSALAINTHYSMAIPLVSQLIYLLVRRNPNWILSTGIALGAITVIPILQYLHDRRSLGENLSWVKQAGLEDLYQMPVTMTLGWTTPSYWPFVSVLMVI